MAQNVASPDTKEIQLGVFGGLCTYMNPTALPMGASPDCSDISFLPGSIFSRPGFKKVFATPFGTATVTYGKSYIDPAGVIRNLYLDSSGNLWVENVTTSPGTYTLLATTTPGTTAKSITAFRREYIAISDGLHGQEVPLQFDGTNLDRVTQDGPGASPTVTSLIIPSSLMPNVVAPPPTLTITAIYPDQRAFPGGYFTTINIYVSATPEQAPVGSLVVISGTGSAYDGGPYTVILNPGLNGAIVCSAVFSSTSMGYTGAGTLTIGGPVPIPNVVMKRVNNLVTVTTNTPHQLQPGYLAQISNMQAGIVGTKIVGIVINNEDAPGVATVTTQSSHGLVPDLWVSLSGILSTAIGGGIASISRVGEVVGVTTNTPHGLSPGSLVTIAGVADASFNTTATVQQVLSTGTGVPGTAGSVRFTFIQVNSTDAASSGGTVSVNWPVPDSPTPSYFQVKTASTPTTFQIEVFYPDGAWTGGTVAYAWDGTFFVQSVLSPTSFTYQQYGPDATATSTDFVMGTTGTVTPYGQIAPGKHQMQMLFLTRQGFTTAPSPPVTFEANGGEFISVSNIPIGPPNVVARIIAFTGAQGAYFFYIPAPPQVNGQLVGTATQINDNVTTGAIFDFGDNTLFNALGISIQGNNLANQIILEGALGFGFYGSRLMTYGQRNTIQNMLNLGFDGGYLPYAPTIPTGWISGDGAGSLVAGHYGQGWQINASHGAGNKGLLSQSFYQDYSGAPIAQPNTQYRLRCWLRPTVAGFAAAGLAFTMVITSASTGFSSIASISGLAMNVSGSWLEAEFSVKTPNVIPADLTLTIYASSSTVDISVVVDELNLIYSESPYLTGLFASYVNNPESFDGVTGELSPVDDTHSVLELGIIRANLYMLTQDPSGRLHETSQGTGEPVSWTVNEVAANCGTVSAFALTRSQADDSSAAGGEEWFAWISSTGIRIFGGEDPDKISQEIQRPQGQTFPGAPEDLGAFNAQAQLTAWALNDPAQKIMWFGIPTGVALAPTIIYQLSYLGLDSASAIVSNPPIHKSLSGRLVATDLGRKWAPWQRTMNGGALMYRLPGEIQPVFFGGNGQSPGAGAGFGNVYTTDGTLLTDDDYGGFLPYYTTYAFPDRDQEQALQLGGHMKMVAYTHTFVAGVGVLTINILYESLANAWPSPGMYTLQSGPKYDLEWAGNMAIGQRFFFKFSVAPSVGTDVQLALSIFTPALKPNKRMPVRGRYP